MDIKSCEFLELSDSYSGVCIKCCEIQDGGVEPDAEGYTCETCGSHSVMGVEQALLCGFINIK